MALFTLPLTPQGRAALQRAVAAQLKVVRQRHRRLARELAQLVQLQEGLRELDEE